MLTPPAAMDLLPLPSPLVTMPNNVLRPANIQTNNANHANIINNFNLFNNLFHSPDHTQGPPERRRLSGNFDSSDHHDQSPDEAAIQARGRRSIPLTYSPDINHTPLRQQMQRAKLAALSQAGGANSRLLLPGGREGVRTSPRKRLTLNDTPPS